MPNPANETVQTEIRERIPLKRRFAYTLFIIIFFILLLGVVEIAVRLTTRHISSLDLLVVTPEQKNEVAKETESAIFVGDPLLLWKLKPNLKNAYWDYTIVSTNSDNFRVESAGQELSPKKDGAIRIICVGDSVTFGYRAPLAFPNAPTIFDPASIPYPMIIEHQLRAANPDKSVEVITMAVPGYTSTQGRAWLERDIDALKPDLLTFSFGWNDASLTLKPDREVMTDDRSTYVYRWLIDHSQIYAHWISWLRLREAASGSRTPQPQRFLESRTSSEEYLNNMSAMVQLARQRKVPFIVLAAPFRDHTENGPDAQRMLLNRLALGDLMKNDEAQYLEIREMTEDTYPANDKFFGERIHPSQIGHKLIASEVMKFIAAQHLLPVLNVPPFEP